MLELRSLIQGCILHHNSLSETILQGTLEGEQRRDRQKNCWMNKIKERTSMLMPELPTKASCRKDWKRMSAESSFMSPQQPSRLKDRIQLKCILMTFISIVWTGTARGYLTKVFQRKNGQTTLIWVNGARPMSHVHQGKKNSTDVIRPQ